MSVFVFVFLPVCVFLSVCLCVCFCLSVSLFLCLSVSVCMFVSVCLCLTHFLIYFVSFLILCLSLCLSLSLSLYLCVSLSLSLNDSSMSYTCHTAREGFLLVLVLLFVFPICLQCFLGGSSGESERRRQTTRAFRAVIGQERKVCHRIFEKQQKPKSQRFQTGM